MSWSITKTQLLTNDFIRELQNDQKDLNMGEEFPRPTRSLSGRVAIVSGAGAVGDGIGNGRASAILLAEAGCSVVCTDIKLELAQRTVEMIEQDGIGKAVAVAADATKEDDCKNAVKVAVDTFGRLDILVNVVGAGGATGTAKEVDMAKWSAFLAAAD